MSSNPRRLLPVESEKPQNIKTKTIELTSFSRRLRELMQVKGMSQSDLARAVWGETKDTRGVKVARNRDRISQYYNGKAVPEPQNLLKIAEVLGVEPKELAPDIIADAIDAADPAVAMNAVSGHPDKVHLRVNTLVSLQSAAEIIAIISRDPTAVGVKH